jgi:hypothetical protein
MHLLKTISDTFELKIVINLKKRENKMVADSLIINNTNDIKSKKSHEIPIDHLDFKYIEKCENVKELENIYKVLCSGVEGRYPELEETTKLRIKTLSPNSRVLREDLPIQSKKYIPKDEQTMLNNEIDDFIRNIANIEETIISSKTEKSSDQLLINDKEQKPKTITITSDSKSKNINKISTTNKKKSSPMPKSHREWEKIENQLEKEEDEEEVVQENKPKTNTIQTNEYKTKNEISDQINTKSIKNYQIIRLILLLIYNYLTRLDRSNETGQS